MVRLPYGTFLLILVSARQDAEQFYHVIPVLYHDMRMLVESAGLTKYEVEKSSCIDVTSSVHPGMLLAYHSYTYNSICFVVISNFDHYDQKHKMMTILFFMYCQDPILVLKQTVQNFAFVA